ncbi:ABC transporter substrate binding protein [Bradyrhizobium sp. NAS96.2]|uniref:ABC transporter substrate binding protein n=1 Tax=Bradyrhizobium sp. NAS96.2 TaxID=1680160 RepID=UPI000B0DF95B|nr:ABC transporter substrate binding protein [Bradyrhizobium sp. NAS96.2]
MPRLITLAAERKLPAIYGFSAAVKHGALKGALPADLPIEQATKVSLKINLKTAKALRIELPPTLLASADEVIE